MKHLIYFFSITVLITSCSGEADEPKKAEAKQPQQDEKPIEEQTEEVTAVPANPPRFNVNGKDFGFAGFIVSIDSITFEGDGLDIAIPKHDTCYYDLDLGENINEVPMRISPTKDEYFTSFEVSQRSLYHFTVNNEGPHCDLIEHTPYYSEWVSLPVVKENYSYTTLDWEQMKSPVVTMGDEAFKALVLEHCGERYANLLGTEYHKNVSATDHLGNSGYEIKIVATLMDGTQKEYIISFSSPMGC